MSAITSPAGAAFAITPSDTVDFTRPARGIYIGVSGDVVVITPENTAVTFKNAAAGSVLPVEAIRVNATLTTATDLVGLV